MTEQVIPHVKMLPECKNVTKQNCVTLWETDDDGKQVVLAMIRSSRKLSWLHRCGLVMRRASL